MIPGIVAGRAVQAAPPVIPPIFNLPFEGANGSTTFTDLTGRTWSRAGSPTISTAQAYAGTSSGLFVGDGNIVSNSNAGDAFGIGDFYIRIAYYPTNITGAKILLECRVSNDNEAVPVIYHVGSDLYYYVSLANRITAPGSITINAWHLIELERVAGTTTLSVNGSPVGSPWADSTNYVNILARIGSNRLNGGEWISGYVDAFRVTK